MEEIMVEINKTKIRSRRGREFWEKHIKIWKSSGLTKAEYCRQNSLGVHSFSNWYNRLKKPINSISFVEVPFKENHIQSKEIFSFDVKMTASYQLKLNIDMSFGFLKNIFWGKSNDIS